MLLDCPEDAIFDCDPHDHRREFLLRVVIGGSLAVFMAIACWLFWRQTIGAFQPLATVVALAVGIGGALVVGLCRWGEWQNQKGAPATISLTNILFTVAIVLFAVAVSFPRVAPLATFLLWLPILGEEAAWWICLYHNFTHAARYEPVVNESRSLVATPPALKPTNSSPRKTQIDRDPVEDFQDEEEAELLPANVTQQVTREQTAEQGEYLYGLLRCKLEKGEQTQNIHVAFCPPLGSVPEIVVRQLEGPNATIKIGVAQTFGARFELRLSAIAADPTDVILQFEARASRRSV